MTVSFDVREIPFSRRGSWLDISPVIALHTTANDLHLVTHTTGMHAVLRFSPEHDGAPIESAVSASPSLLRWSAEAGVVEAVFESSDTVRLRGSGVSLRIADATSVLTPFTGTFFFRDPIDGSAVFTSYESGRRYRVTSIRGDLSFEGDEALGSTERAVIASGTDGWEIAIEQFETARAPYRSTAEFDEIEAGVASEFASYVDQISGWRTDASPSAESAAYVLWSATVAPAGFLGRESVLMSKHWMDKVWSWDHCFNALALAADPAAAIDQFLAPFDHQDPSGALPDSVTHSEVLYNFVKPPIHGWAFARLRSALAEPLPEATVRAVYDSLARWTRFWLDLRRVAGHPLAHYQHGNDSGWDNATTFDRDRLIESPDLAAFLVTQLDVLADLAIELGIEANWKSDSDAMASALLDQLWTGEEFVARAVMGGRASKTTSLLTLLPIIAADRLPVDVLTRLAAGIEAHLTEFGPATQLPGTAEYEDDGYWRGPIWAPSTILIEDGLRRSGFIALADRVSASFRRLCELSGFAENFDAITGQGLRDRAYTWTASSYLVLAREAEARER